MIEAVFEDPKVKAQVFAEIEPHLADGALLGSNTSTLPITELAEGVSRPGRLHRPALLLAPWTRCRCWRSSRASRPRDETLYRALDVAKQIKKTPIVVNDSRGFFTSRVIGTFINEGIAMLAEGIPAPSIEQASSQAGYPAPVLQLSDELNLKLMRKIRKAAQGGARPTGARLGRRTRPRRSSTACSTSSSAPASSRARASTSTRTASARGLWPGLREAFPPVDDPSSISLQRPRGADAVHRGASRSVKCLDEGVIESVADANIGSIMGIGFPGWTGGVLQYINGYDGGLPGFVARARELAEHLRRALRAAGLAGRARRARRAVPRRREGRRHRLTQPSGELLGLSPSNRRSTRAPE